MPNRSILGTGENEPIEKNVRVLFNFEDTIKQNPCRFIAYFKRKYQHIRGDRLKLDLFEQHLSGRAKIWLEYTLTQNFTFEGISRAFLDYFWGEKEQENAVEKLSRGRFEYNKGEKPDEYAIKLYYMAENVDRFHLSREATVNQIAKHFGESVTHAVTIQGVRTFPDLLKLLNKFPEEILRKECRGREFREDKRRDYRQDQGNLGYRQDRNEGRNQPIPRNGYPRRDYMHDNRFQGGRGHPQENREYRREAENRPNQFRNGNFQQRQAQNYWRPRDAIRDVENRQNFNKGQGNGSKN